MNRFFKLYKFLFEDDKYKNIGLNSKVAYCVYRDLIQQNKNVKKDKEGKVYIENPRKYLMKTLNVSINTVTKIHKELNSVGLIKDVWDDVGKPNILYIKYCETPKPQVIHAVQAKVAKEYPNINLVGAEDGYFTDDLELVARRIAKTQPDMVFAALGFPKQEQLLAILRRNELPALMMGVGGSFDVFSGMVKRAPEAFQKTHLEWFYRLITNPTRFKRMLVLPQFVARVQQSKRGK